MKDHIHCKRCEDAIIREDAVFFERWDPVLCSACADEFSDELQETLDLRKMRSGSDTLIGCIKQSQAEVAERRMDDLGRMVIPKAMRDALGWEVDVDQLYRIERLNGGILITQSRRERDD